MKVSDAGMKVLVNLHKGKSPGSHLIGRGQWGGFQGTVYALLKRGLVFHNKEHEMELTEKGRQFMAENGFA